MTGCPGSRATPFSPSPLASQATTATGSPSAAAPAPVSSSTPLRVSVLNPVNFRLFRPDLEDPTEEDVRPVYRTLNALPIPYVEADDISNAVLFLVSDEGRYVTGVALPVDAGYAVK